MRHYWDDSIFCSPVHEPLSFEELLGLSLDESGERERFDHCDPGPDPSQLLECAEVIGAVEIFVAALSERQREIVSRVFWLGENQAAVARCLGVSKMAVCKALKRALELGCQQLAEHRASILLH